MGLHLSCRWRWKAANAIIRSGMMQKGDVHLVAEVEKEIELKSMEFTRIDQLLLACKAALYRPKVVADPALKEEPGGELMAEEVSLLLCLWSCVTFFTIV